MSRSPVGVIAILLGPLRTAPSGLEVPLRYWADPHLGPGWRNAQGLYALQLLLITNGGSMRGPIGKPSTRALAPDARTCIRDIMQARLLGRCDRVSSKGRQPGALPQPPRRDGHQGYPHQLTHIES